MGFVLRGSELMVKPFLLKIFLKLQYHFSKNVKFYIRRKNPPVGFIKILLSTLEASSHGHHFCKLGLEIPPPPQSLPVANELTNDLSK
jgi:hypothetical protein